MTIAGRSVPARVQLMLGRYSGRVELGGTGPGGRGEYFHLSHRAVGGVELFDLESDPAERYHRAEEFPERVAELKARIETMAAAVPGNRKRG